MKRIIKKIIPKSLFSVLKLWYYNVITKRYKFGLQEDIFLTSDQNSWDVRTNKPLYFIVKDLDRDERYYKISKDDIVLDAGANEGSLSVVYSKKVGINGKVFAFEPDRLNINTLQENIDLNEGTRNISIVPKALWDKTETIEFYEAGTVGSSIFYEDENAKKVSMKAISIDDFVTENALDRLDFIKMDIEGAEIEALSCAIDTIGKFNPFLSIASYHIVNGEATYRKLENFFKENSYPFKSKFYKDGEIITYAGPELSK